jgi:hypothetical protein
VFKILVLSAALASLAFAATTTATSTAPKNGTAKKAVHSTAAHTTTAHSTAAHTTPHTARSGKTSARATSSRSRRTTSKTSRPIRSYQQAPTPDRYKEIQQALIDKGYLHGEATGQWGPDSADALKRFQADQNITADGKISALSLIGLGLGPKRLTAQSSPQTPANSPPNSSK